MKGRVLFFIVATIFVVDVFAREGMWIPSLLKKYNIAEMQEMGFQLSAGDIYSEDSISLKDAVVLFGSGCTGGIISDEGLLITNHHCGYGAIQSHSSLEQDYLTEGFWAKSKDEELPNKKLSVKLLVSMADVTGRVMKGVTGSLSEKQRKDSISVNIALIKEEFRADSFNVVDVKPLFYGNKYYVYVYEEFKDVRLVGAPPSSIGKFGGDTDNWMWPRHTGDISLFRIYADKDNRPAGYSPDNVPYKPKNYFRISMKGYNKNDFTMVLGYPGKTLNYLPSHAVDLIVNQSNPAKISIRGIKLDILAEDMAQNREVRIKYAAKYAGTSNSWKKWKGEIKGLKRLRAVEAKKEYEKQFMAWVNGDEERKEKYGDIFNQFDILYSDYSTYQKGYDYYNEIIYRGTDIFSLARKFSNLNDAVLNGDSTRMADEIKSVKSDVEEHYKNYNMSTDEKVFAALLDKYGTDLPGMFLPGKFKKIVPQTSEQRFLEKYYRKSVLTDSSQSRKLLDNYGHKSVSKMKKDPVFKLYSILKGHYLDSIKQKYFDVQKQIVKVQKLYMEAIIEMNNGKQLMADANLTLRIAYGKVEGYVPRDGVEYNFFTTLDGIIEKDNAEIYDYNIPGRLREIYRSRDYGNYINHTGSVPVAFCASNHTTGGNSGSPVLNGNGQLIGVNFDRCWEGTMSDIMFDPDMCRNIMVDIRYALFIIDKYADAGYLLNEMDIVY